MNRSPKRPWYRLHAVTWLIAGFVCVALVSANCFGRRTKATGAEGPLEYGWPEWFASRGHLRFAPEEYIGLVSEPISLLDIPSYEPRDRWFSRRHLVYLDRQRAIVNLLLAVVVLGGVVWTVERWCRYLVISPSFTLRTLFALTSWAACYVVFQQKDGRDWFNAIPNAATVVAYLGMALAWLAFFDLLGGAWRLLTSSSRREYHRRRERERISTPTVESDVR